VIGAIAGSAYLFVLHDKRSAIVLGLVCCLVPALAVAVTGLCLFFAEWYGG